MTTDDRAEPVGSEREALQALEIMLRPGEGQCEPTIAHTVLRSWMTKFGIEVADGTEAAMSIKGERKLIEDTLPTLGEKAEHVRRAGQDRRHTCHWPGCDKQVPPAMWGCKPHWFGLPKRLRDRVWATYVPGQEQRMDPSDEYLDVAHEVQSWIEDWLADAGGHVR